MMFVSESTIGVDVAHWESLGYKSPCCDQHGHRLNVTIRIVAGELNEFGLVCDWRAVNDIIEKMDHKVINKIEPFTQTSPSLESLAKVICDWVMNVLELESNQPLVYEIELNDGQRKLLYKPDYETGEEGKDASA
jgi:6-pyruvoyltetrahydropterin/6-carboxytetrahydropterin synthase